MVAFKDPLTLDIGYLSILGSSFVIEIQAHARRIGLEQICKNKTKIRQFHYCSSLYICHTKAMTTLAEFGTRCLYENTNFYCPDRSVCILTKTEKFSVSEMLRRELLSVWQAYAESHGNIFNYSKTCLYDV